MPSTANAPIPVYHRRGQFACGQVALGVKVRHPFGDGKSFPADNVVTVTGEQPIRGTVPICGSCGRVIDSFAELDYAIERVDTASRLTRWFTKFVHA